ncbi:MAG: FtsX-like permease family protein, partial [Muribaculaceae bacterium]|nr:FtsX-like permease family protein [Muribaculaceae bacterium]
VLSRSLARRIFGEYDVAGREVMVNMMPYTVVGVVEDVSPLLSTTYAGFYLVFTRDYGMSGNEKWFGNTQVALLLKDGVSPDRLRQEVKGRYATLGAQVAKEGAELIYHEQPYDAETVAEGGYGSNNTPDMKSKHVLSYFLYGIMILLPAINLSSMTRSRLRHRVSEIGVRRAFGARRISILVQMLGENFVITIIGGVIGLVLSVVFILLASNLFFLYSGSMSSSSLDVVNARPSFDMLFTWSNFFVALALCFILNLISATVPAWQASRVEPAVAIAKVK